jgi:hypothetical protein
VRFFGKPWSSPATDSAEYEPPPVGKACHGSCGNPIAADDQGMLIPHVDVVQDDVNIQHWGDETAFATIRTTRTEVTIRPWHLDCLLQHLGIGNDCGLSSQGNLDNISGFGPTP